MSNGAKTSESIYIGVHLSASLLKGALVNAAGEVVYETSLPTERESAEKLLAQILGLVIGLRDDQRAKNRVAGIGVGVPGLVNRRTGKIEVLPNLPNLTDVDVIGELADKSGLPVVLDNDSNAAAFGELQAGAARGRSDVFYVSLGIGIGAGIIINGLIYRGAIGFAGEFGHITIDPEGIECGCGNVGCLETICSGPNIVRRTKERLYRDRTSSLSRLAIPRDRELTAEDIAQAARQGDEMSQVMMERTGMFLGIALAAVINLLNVEMIVLGGGVMEAGELILKPATKEAKRRAFPPSFNSCEIVVAKLEPCAGLIGAALLARDLQS